MIGRDTEMSRAFLEHLEDGVQYTEHRAVGRVLALVEAPQPVKVTEQLVGAVDQVNDHRTRRASPHRRAVDRGLDTHAGIVRGSPASRQRAAAEAAARWEFYARSVVDGCRAARILAEGTVTVGQHDLDAAILLAAGGRVVRGDRKGLAQADGVEPI